MCMSLDVSDDTISYSLDAVSDYLERRLGGRESELEKSVGSGHGVYRWRML